MPRIVYFVLFQTIFIKHQHQTVIDIINNELSILTGNVFIYLLYIQFVPSLLIRVSLFYRTQTNGIQELAKNVKQMRYHFNTHHEGR